MLQYIKYTKKVCIKKLNKIMQNFSQGSLTKGQCLIQNLQNAEQHTAHTWHCALQRSTH